MDNNIAIETKYYPESMLWSWMSGHYVMLRKSHASQFIKDILIEKTKIKHNRHTSNVPVKRTKDFFGEAFIASQLETEMVDGWYNSYKWLTSERWLTGRGLEPGHKTAFYRKALMRYIGYDALKDLQRLAAHCEKKLSISPVPPDLWIITSHKNRCVFKFIESKLPGDRIADGQILGLLIISNYLRAITPAQVYASVVCLSSEERKEERTVLQVRQAIRDFVKKGYCLKC